MRSVIRLLALFLMLHIVSQPLYGQDRDFLAPVKIKGKWGYINPASKMVIDPIFDDAKGFSNGLAPARINEHWGYLDNSGNWAMAPVLTSAGSFNNNRACVLFFDPVDSLYYKPYIDKSGKYIFEIALNETPWGYHDGYVRVRGTSEWGSVAYGYKDTTGEWAIPAKYTDATDFSEGLAGVKYVDKWGFIDRNDTLVIPMEYDEVFIFNDGVSRVRQGDHYMVIDKTGSVLLSTRYELDFIAQDGLIGFKKKDKYGFMDLKGKVVVPARYENMMFNKFSEGLAVVIKEVDGKKIYGYVNDKGKEIISPRFEFAVPFRNGYAIAKLNGKFGFIDKTGKWQIEPVYEGAIDFMTTY